VTETQVDIVVGIGAAVIGAVLGFIGAYFFYLKERSERDKAYYRQKRDADDAYRRQREDVEKAYRQQHLDSEMSVRITRVVMQHDLCAAAKDWLRNLPNWGNALSDKERADNIRAKAESRMNECYIAWDQALNGIDQPDVLVVMAKLKTETQAALIKVQSGEELTPDVRDLQEALREFRETVNRELHTQL
jgi:hypothetical protein